MENSDIRIDKEGVWYYKGAHMFRKEILCTFFEHLKIDESGKYLIELGEERCYLDVEDTAFVVAAVDKIQQPGDGQIQIDVLLSDGSCEKLDMNSLHTGKDNVLYCQVKEGKFTARFLRNSYYQLAEFIEQSENENIFYINLNGEKYMINETQASETQ
jgi:uncharacterized protein